MTSEKPSETASAKARQFIVTGTPGAGKTTFAKALAERYGILHVEADRYRYKVPKEGEPPKWDKVPVDEFVHAVYQVIRGPAGENGWVMDTSLFDAHDPEHARARLIGSLLNNVDDFPCPVGTLNATVVVVLACRDVEFALKNIDDRHAVRVATHALVGPGVIETDEAVNALKTKIVANWPAILSALDVFTSVVPVAVEHTDNSFPATHLPDDWIEVCMRTAVGNDA